MKKKKKQTEIKLERVQEIKEAKEKKIKRERAKTLKKIEEMIHKKKILEIEKQKRLQLAIQENQERKANVLTNQEMLKREDSDFREGILLYQREAIGRSLQKDKAAKLKRIVAQ